MQLSLAEALEALIWQTSRWQRRKIVSIINNTYFLCLFIVSVFSILEKRRFYKVELLNYYAKWCLQ